MKPALRLLLDRLDAIRRQHVELTEPEVRAALIAAIYHSFILRTPGYALPESLGMGSAEGNAAVRIALAEFLDATANCGARTPVQRYAAFQDPTVASGEGHCYEDYFGYAPSFEALVAAASRVPIERPVPPKSAGPWWQFWKQSESRIS